MKKTILSSLIILFFYQTVNATIFTVDTNSDVSSGTGTTGSLRWCITQANLTAAKDTINFSIASTWTVGSNYPVITYPLCINGFSAPGAVQGQLGTGARQLKIILNGAGSSSIYGFQITAANCEIKGLVIQDFFKGIYISGASATANWIWGCYIGTAADGLSISAATTCWDDAIALNNNASSNLIGTNGDGSNDANEGNLISGNGDGAQFYGEGIAINEGGTIANDCTGNRIAGNYFGTNETGTAALYTTALNTQRGSGIQINYSTANIIGTNGDGVSDALERNVISGNSDCGIVFIGGSSNKIKGNYIGTTKTGLVGLPNYANGGTSIIAVQISIKTSSNNNIIGTDGDGTADNIEGNVIGSVTFASGSANSYNYGMVIQASTGNRVAGNKIGIGSDGVTALNIVCTGATYIDKCIYISSSSTSTVVGTNGDGVSDAYESNYFGNSGSAVTIDNSNSCIVAGNYFGLGTNLTTAEALSSSGTYILNSTSCRIGSSASNSLERNYYCNSAYDGVWIDGNATANNDLNTIQYNTFGMRPDGVAAANAYHAIEIYKGSNANTIQNNIVTQNGTFTPDGTYSAVLIGGINSGEESSGNLIYQNQIYKNIGRGIDILNVSGSTLSVKNKISQNSIYNNGNASNSTASAPAFGKYSSGIDLDWDGPTGNDNKDVDNGPNEMINFPVITGTTSTGTGCTSATISGTYNGLLSTQYYVELFSSDVCNGDTAGVDYYSNSTYNYGEGKTYIGSSAVFTTNGAGGSAGNGTWASSVPLTVSGKYITAVAIQTSGTNIGNTSEFSQCYPIAFDAGDAPDTYHTLLSNCGPTHFGVATTLKIGATIDADGDGVPTAAANGDGADEDGISTLPALNVKSTSYTLSNIPVTNTTGSTATLYAWIDFDVDGSFESGEFASATVANGATTSTLTWNLSSFVCGTTINPGVSYLRLRLTTDALADVAGTTNVDERCYGRASNGEIEDYKLYISGYDYGDLPNTYPTATVLCYEDTATAKVWAGATRPDRECTQNYSADATGDGSEEDGLTISFGASGANYNWVLKLNANQANKTVYYGIWIDWDGNQNFTSGIDSFYSGSAVVTGLTNVNVPVYVPYGITNSGFRLIVSDAPITRSMYNSTTINNGEIEDWLLLKILASPGNILMGNRQAAANVLKWKNISGLAVTNYTLERSNDNLSWATLGSVTPLPGNDASIQYSYSDVHPGRENYYRLKFSLTDNTYQYSNIVPLFDKTNLLPVIIYPNPATNTLTIQTANSNYKSLRIIDLTGRMEMSRDINSINTVIDISNLAAGTHLIKIITKDGEEVVRKFVKIK